MPRCPSLPAVVLQRIRRGPRMRTRATAPTDSLTVKQRPFNVPQTPRDTATSKREILVPASVRIAREKIAAKLEAARARAAARAKLRAAREELEIARAALKIAKALDRKAAQKERDAARLDRQAQRVAFQLARHDRLEEQRLQQRARVTEVKTKRKQRDKPARKSSKK
jgi:hypothetical protein